ncbi:response regulator transcription factor [Flagellimonas myxillae]|uniref:response regulator transcription factor n=1 Tax=Flagellimonas myxillae TaxID=2942214 RepID=UPI00201E9CD2|nr:helix-turn-helix transcriptional regulator [Muricauda myxillae]MCL6267441.1 helix-turn-helix transcriptional regulator [Muricauda myxillae]
MSIVRPRLREILNIYDNNPRYLAKDKIDVDKEKLNQLIANIYSPGPSFQFIFEFGTQGFAYVSPSCKNLFGVDPKTFTLSEYTTFIHPKDLELVTQHEQLAVFFLYDFIPREEIQNYKVSYQLRVKDENDNYKLFLHQAISFALDDNHKMLASLVNHSDISHITTTNNNKVSFINIREGKSYYNISSKNELEKYTTRVDKINPRETEILGLISEGLTSKEIADYLYISVETVKTHRRNILAKNDFKNISHAITFYLKQGLL